MIRSMTGYGEAEGGEEGERLRVEIRTVNHRHFHLTARGPRGVDRLNARLERWLRGAFSRGHATVSVTRGSSNPGEAPVVAVDMDRARAYRDALRRMQEELGLSGEVELGTMARFTDVFRAPEAAGEGEGVDVDLLQSLVEGASRAVVRMREEEGARLQQDLEERLVAMEGHLSTIRDRAPRRMLAERDRLRQAVQELTDELEVDEERLAREVAYLAERWDISEEVVRFDAHVAAFRDALDSASAEAVGKRLTFLAQELLREANTIASKANDAEIAQAAVALKEEIERIREQVENVE